MAIPRSKKATIAGLKRQLDEAQRATGEYMKRYERAVDEKDSLQRQLTREKEAHDETRGKARTLKAACQDLQFNLNRAQGYIDRVRETEAPVERRHGGERRQSYRESPVNVETSRALHYPGESMRMHWTEIDV